MKKKDFFLPSMAVMLSTQLNCDVLTHKFTFISIYFFCCFNEFGQSNNPRTMCLTLCFVVIP